MSASEPQASDAAESFQTDAQKAKNIFNNVWHKLALTVGEEPQLKFPQEIFWLGGAPGAGKGTHTSFIMQCKGFQGSPIVISDLLQSAEAKKRKDAGLLVDDAEVFLLLLKRLLDKEFENGAMVDGFPRTTVQAECLKLFYDKLLYLKRHSNTPNPSSLNPCFHVLVLFVEESESIKRQLKRGQESISLNKSPGNTKQKIEIRKTDLDKEAARNRYRTFKRLTYNALQSLKPVFCYHHIDANGTIESIREQITNVLK